jgi:hypothetical protein
MTRRMKIFLAALLLAVGAGMMYFRVLRERISQIARPERAERQAARELTRPATAQTDPQVKARIFWLAAEQPGELQAEEVSLPLSSEPVTRAKQLIEALISSPPSPAQRTLPADAVLLEFYILPDGLAVADFSGSFAGQTPSGILSEQLAVDSVVRTLAASVEPVRRLKILIQGQEVDTLAGHLDLTGFFIVRPSAGAVTLGELTPEKSGTTLKPHK